jgi:hypothetical protein
MRAPLVELREKIEQFRGSVDVSLVAIKNGLKQRSEAASARETLELLLDTFHVVSKVAVAFFVFNCDSNYYLNVVEYNRLIFM